MWGFFEDEKELDPVTSEFNGVSQSIFEAAETQEAGLLALQDAYKSFCSNFCFCFSFLVVLKG